MTVLKDGQLVVEDIPLRNAMNELLRGEYAQDCAKVCARWNRSLKKAGSDFRVKLPSTRFHRRQGIYADASFDLEGNIISPDAFEAKRDQWLPTEADRDYVRSLMHPVYESGKVANWIAAPAKGINGQEQQYEYVRV
jgi:benzoyl-CoA 2,3-dioxygenase component B